MARKRRRSIGDTVLLLVILAALVWAFAPGVGWDLLGLRSRLGWPPLRSGQALSSLPDSEAARQLRELTVRESVDDPAAPAYDREAFGQRWADTDHNGCDTRNDVLDRDLSDKTVADNGCQVLAGVLDDPYTGNRIGFQRGKDTSSAVQIDHIVPLHYAYVNGAWQWDAQKRLAFANDMDNLLAVDGPANQAKGDRGPASWMPGNAAYHCEYAQRFVSVASDYGLGVPEQDKAALRDALASCAD